MHFQIAPSKNTFSKNINLIAILHRNHLKYHLNFNLYAWLPFSQYNYTLLKTLGDNNCHFS